MKNQKIIIALSVLVVVGVVGFFAYRSSNAEPGQYDDFASCLTESNVKMYGAYWCPHCQNQKEMFGKSWKYVEYVECALPNQQGQSIVCQQAGIESYPTWEFGDGSRQSGELTFEELSQQSGCPFGEQN